MDDLETRFTYHAPTQPAIDFHADIRMRCLQLATHLDGLLPDSREKSLATTHLEEVMFWANAAIARHISARAGT